MKNPKRILTGIVALTVCFSAFVSCGKKVDSGSSDTAETSETQTETTTKPETTTEPPTEKPTENPVDSLYGTDKEVYDALIKLSAGFNNPSSIRLVAKPKGALYPVYKISGENAFGGSASEWYMYDEDTKKMEPAMNHDSFELQTDTLDIILINKALEYHFNEVGY